MEKLEPRWVKACGPSPRRTERVAVISELRSAVSYRASQFLFVCVVWWWGRVNGAAGEPVELEFRNGKAVGRKQDQRSALPTPFQSLKILVRVNTIDGRRMKRPDGRAAGSSLESTSELGLNARWTSNTTANIASSPPDSGISSQSRFARWILRQIVRMIEGSASNG